MPEFKHFIYLKPHESEPMILLISNEKTKGLNSSITFSYVTMKTRITVSVNEDILVQIRELIRNERIFRNKSHVVECAIYDFLKNKRGLK